MKPISFLPLFAFAFSAPLFAQSLERVSVSAAGLEGNGISSRPSLSSDGGLIAFYSESSNIIPGDLNQARDIFVRDTNLGTLERVSVSTTGIESNGKSSRAVITGDGRYVTFYSDGSNLVPGDTNLQRDIFVRDRLLGTTSLVSRSSTGALGNGASSRPSISDDGRLVAFRSYASNLVAGDFNLVGDVFVVDRDVDGNGVFDEPGGTSTTLVSKNAAGTQGNALSSLPRISADGLSITFRSDASNLVFGDTNGKRDVFVYDIASAQITLVSKASTGAASNGDSTRPSISDDGRFVSFFSDASNLVAGDTNQHCALDIFGQLVCIPGSDCFVVDRDSDGNGVFDEALGTSLTRVSVTGAGLEANDRSEDPEISGNGRYIGFWTDATNLFAGDTNGVQDAVVLDRDADGNGIFDEVGGTSIKLLNQSAAGVQGNGVSKRAVVSDQGEVSAFRSDATNLVAGDLNAMSDVFFNPYVPACVVNIFGTSTPACSGPISIGMVGCPTEGSGVTMTSAGAPPLTAGFLGVTLTSIPSGMPILGVTAYIDPLGSLFLFNALSDAAGDGTGVVPLPPGSAGFTIFAQFVWFNTTTCGGAGTFSASEALETVILP